MDILEAALISKHARTEPHNLSTVTLKAKKTKAFAESILGFSAGASNTFKGQPQSGDWVRVCAKGAILGWGHYAPNASIAVRMMSFDETCPDDAWWHDRIAQAVAVRRDLGLFQSENQNACRLVHAEGDGLPGLIADLYNGILVLQCHTPGMHRAIPVLSAAFQEALGESLVGIYDKSSKTLVKNGGEASEDGWVFGKAPEGHLPPNTDINSTSIGSADKKRVSSSTNAKTEPSSGRCLMARRFSMCSVTLVASAFTPWKSGATEVHSLDSSQRALDVCEDNVKLNGLNPRLHRSIQADAMEFLKTDALGDYDIVVLDPPAFAKRASARHAAVQGYKRINLRAMEGMKAGSLLFTFSCSQAVDDALFTNTIVAAAIQAGRTVRILHRLHQPADHPVNAFHPEGSYLKGLVLRIDD